MRAVSDSGTVTFVGPKLGAPSFRLRLASLPPFLDQRGLGSRIVELPRRPEWLRIWRLRETWATSRVVVFSKLRLLAGELGFVKRRCPTWVLDVDDAIMFGKPRRHGDPPDQARWRQRRFARMVRHCAAVVAGSSFLAEQIERGHGTLTVLHTPVDLSRYPLPARTEDHDTLRLAWIGLGENLRYLEDLHPVLADLAGNGVKLELRVISNRLPKIPGVTCRLLPWSEASEGGDLTACDVGLAPLPDDLWTRGKGGYRCIQYAAASLPCVASPVGANQDVVCDGETGLLATTHQEWTSALQRLAADPSWRRRLGTAARARAASFDLPVFAARYADLLASLAETHPPSG